MIRVCCHRNRRDHSVKRDGFPESGVEAYLAMASSKRRMRSVTSSVIQFCRLSR